MSGWEVFLFTLGAVGTSALGVLGFVCLLPSGDSDRSTATKERDGDSLPAGSYLVRQEVWPRIWTHEAPGMPFTVSEAHHEMQRHRDCSIDFCPRKAVALRVLIKAGRVRPDSSRQRPEG